MWIFAGLMSRTLIGTHSLLFVCAERSIRMIEREFNRGDGDEIPSPIHRDVAFVLLKHANV